MLRRRCRPEDPRGKVCLAFALTGEREFDEAVSLLASLAEEGHSPERDFRGLGAPLPKVVNIIYLTCWANFDAAYNRKASVSVTGPNGFTDTVRSARVNRVLTVRQRKAWKKRR